MSILRRFFSRPKPAAKPAPSMEEISRVVAEKMIERRKGAFPKLPLGFTFEPSGRAGCIYFKEIGRMIEFDCEMSGVPEYDILLWPEGVKEWCHPETTPVPEEKQKQILAELKIWLRKQRLRSDLDRPDQPVIK